MRCQMLDATADFGGPLAHAGEADTRLRPSWHAPTVVGQHAASRRPEIALRQARRVRPRCVAPRWQLPRLRRNRWQLPQRPVCPEARQRWRCRRSPVSLRPAAAATRSGRSDRGSAAGGHGRQPVRQQPHHERGRGSPRASPAALASPPRSRRVARASICSAMPASPGPTPSCRSLRSLRRSSSRARTMPARLSSTSATSDAAYAIIAA